MRFILFLLFFSSNLFAIEQESTGFFSGRISKINKPASLVRFKVDFQNFRYLNKKDRLEFWGENHESAKCSGVIVGKSNDYFLLKVTNFSDCERKTSFSPGFYYHFYSQDLANNVKMGKELMEVLVKKRLALGGKANREKIELDKHIEKVNALNERYRVLREKLESEWRDEIAHVEEDRSAVLKHYNDTLIQLNEVDSKIEQYKVTDQNLKEDRWSLDSRYYYKK